MVLDAVAEATGRTRDEVLNFAREHGLAADLVIESVNRMRDTWILQAEAMGGTVEQAMTRIQNAIQRAVGKTGEGGAFQPLTDSLNNFASTLENDRIVSGIMRFGSVLIETLDLVLLRESIIFAWRESHELLKRSADATDIATGRAGIRGRLRAIYGCPGSVANALYPGALPVPRAREPRYRRCRCQA